MKKALFCCCIFDVWFKVAEKLSDEASIEPAYFIGWKNDLDIASLHKRFPNCTTQFVEDAWHGLGFPKNSHKSVVDEKTHKEISFEILNGIRMMDRLDPSGYNFPATERHYWFLGLIENWLGILESNNIQLIISPSIPHRVFDYALYVAAKIKNVKFIMLQMTPFGDNSFIIDNIEETPALPEADKGTELISPLILEKIKKTRTNYCTAIPSYMVDQNKTASKRYRALRLLSKTGVWLKNFNTAFSKGNSYWVKKGTRPEDSSFSKMQIKKIKFLGQIKKTRLKKLYTSLCTEQPNSDYIVIALHYQPEETSCPTGGLYVEQRQIVKLVADCVEERFKIVIKEHSSQFHPDMEGETGRVYNYYKDILDISPKISLAKTECDPFELISKATAVVTISGTIGWESVIRGVPSIIFGRTWYERMPGVFKVKTEQDLLLALEKIKEKQYNISDSQIITYHKRLQKTLISAAHYKAFSKTSKHSTETSSENIKTGILDYITKNKL